MPYNSEPTVVNRILRACTQVWKHFSESRMIGIGIVVLVISEFYKF
jgi:hypothetical protein